MLSATFVTKKILVPRTHQYLLPCRNARNVVRQSSNNNQYLPPFLEAPTLPSCLLSLKTWACALPARWSYGLTCILSFYWAVKALYLNNKWPVVYPALINSIKKRLVHEHLQSSCFPKMLKQSHHWPLGSQVSPLTCPAFSEGHQENWCSSIWLGS